MMRFATINPVRFYLSLAVVWLLVRFLSYFDGDEILLLKFLNEIWRLAYLLPINFFFLEYGIPFIRRKSSKILTGFLLGIIILVLVSFGLYAWIWLGLELEIYTQFRFVTLNGDYLDHLLAVVSFEAEEGVLSVIFFGFGKIFHRNLVLKEKAQQMRLEKQEAELNFLKSQINPHFLFNTLNNIYSLARDKSDLAPESILRLSEMLRFVLYETNSQYITLDQELEIIRNYIALEKMRYSDSLRIEFDYKIDDFKQLLPPLLLVPLVENAFKHGVSETNTNPMVLINLMLDNERLIFKVQNSSDCEENEGKIKEGVGISNLKRQLELLFKDFTLSLKQEKGVFEAQLNINLSSRV